MYRSAIIPLVFALLFTSIKCAQVNHGSLDEAKVYDYVIVGGGVAGLVLAARLSESENKTVVLLEAGPDGGLNKDINTPAFAGVLQGSQFSWNFTSTPQPTLNGAVPSLAQGHCLGGGSAINVMAYCRGASSVFDEWAEISGNDGLRWENLLTEFEQSSVLEIPPDLPYTIIANKSVYGQGPVMVSYETNLTNFDPTFANTFKNDPQYPAKLVDLTDGTGIGQQVGGPHSIRLSNGTRSYALPAYGYQMAGRNNAQIMHGVWASKINFDNKTAVSVTYTDKADNSTHTVKGKEIIISAGALNTPKLLMLSGVGPKDHLTDLGIPIVQDSPQIGSNLYDHHSAVVMVQVPEDIFTLVQQSNASVFDPILQEYQANGTGPLGRPGGSSFATERIPDDILKSFGVNVTFHTNLPKDRPHVLYQYATGAFQPNPNNLNVVSTFVALIQPEASGYMRLNSTDYRANPLIYSNYFGSAADMAIEVYAYNRLRSLMQSDAMKPVIVSEVYPGKNVTTEAELKTSLYNSARSFHHPAGTVSLGKALDPDFRLKGLNGIRVIDSSAIPVMPTCHLQASVYALAEHAAKLIKDQL
jgi:choline dehydrogenase